MYFANELEKLYYFSIFICISRKNVVYLHPQFHAGDVCASSAGVADILKRRLLTLCSDSMKLRNFQLYAGLSNGRCPTGYRLSSLCLLVLVCPLRICVCAHAHLNYVAREYIYIRRGLQRCRFKDAGNAKASKTWNDNSRTPRFFYMPNHLTTNPHSWEFLCTTWH